MLLTEPRPASILVVEDSRELVKLLQRLLAQHGYQVAVARDGEAAVERATASQPDLVLLDVGLPGRDGLQVAAELRRLGVRSPVLMLTARGEVADRVSGLDAGADDYLPKPFDTDELLARIRALLRRASSPRGASQLLRVGDLVIDPVRRTAARGRQPVSLSRTEYALLEYLVRRAGTVVAREQILRDVWGQTTDLSTNVVDVYIGYLRRKVDANRRRKLVHTVRGRGYMLSLEPPSTGANGSVGSQSS